MTRTSSSKLAVNIYRIPARTIHGTRSNAMPKTGLVRTSHGLWLPAALTWRPSPTKGVIVTVSSSTDVKGDGPEPGGLLRPLILVRGFGGVGVADEQRNAYQGFNDGTVYPGRRGDNFIYEGFVLRAIKSQRYRYTDATNVVGYYASAIEPPTDLMGFDPDDVTGTVALDPRTAAAVLQNAASGTLWIYRYYDLDPRSMATYGKGLMRLVRLIAKAMANHGGDGGVPGVDIVAHSMGGLVVREALRAMHEQEADSAHALVHRIVTLGTPHRGIAFQGFPKWLLQALPKADKAADEISAFDPERTDFLRVAEWFDPQRILTVVGTNYQSYSNNAASIANRISSLFDEGTLATNRSDGLVKHSAAQLPGAPRTFVHKCHGGPDSLVTSREAYEISMRFFHGTHRVRLWLDKADISRGQDLFGKSEFYFGASIKPRGVDFELFHQSIEAENCYGPFRDRHLQDGPPDLQAELRKAFAETGDKTTGWAGPDRLIWEGCIDATNVPDPARPAMVFRLDLYVGERDSRGIGFSDNVVFRKQYYVQVIPGSPMEILVHTGEKYLTEDPELDLQSLIAHARQLTAAAEAGRSPEVQVATQAADGWTFGVGGTGFTATLRVGVDRT